MNEFGYPIELTEEEARAIRSLKRLAKKWPKMLWLYSASGSLNMMKKDECGKHAAVRLHGGQYGISGVDGVDPDYIAADVNIDNDGGDW